MGQAVASSQLRMCYCVASVVTITKLQNRISFTARCYADFKVMKARVISLTLKLSHLLSVIVRFMIKKMRFLTGSAAHCAMI